MTGELGQLSLCFALALSLVMAVSGLMGAQPSSLAARKLATSSAMGFLVFVALAFGTLTYAFVVSDFSILAVANNCYGFWCWRSMPRWWRACSAAASG